jgi:DNA-binding transcriptional MerR regulator
MLIRGRLSANRASIQATLKSASQEPGAACLIAEAAARAGTHPSTVRVWEARYGWPVPIRTKTGFRLYSTDTVDTLRVVVAQVKAGRPIGDILRLGEPDLAPPAPRRIDRSAADRPATIPADITSPSGLDLARQIVRMVGLGLSAAAVRAHIESVWTRCHPRERTHLAAMVAQVFAPASLNRASEAALPADERRGAFDAALPRGQRS